MKIILATATGLSMMTSGAFAAPAQPGVEHFSKAPINGQPLPFSYAVRVGDTIYLSGQLGMGPDGKLPNGIEAQTKQVMTNVERALRAALVGTRVETEGYEREEVWPGASGRASVT